MSVHVKSLWSETERQLLTEGEIPNPEYIRQYRYKIREKIRNYIGQLTDALIHPEVRDKRLIPPVLSMAEEVLRAYGYDDEANKVSEIRTKIVHDIVREVIEK